MLTLAQPRQSPPFLFYCPSWGRPRPSRPRAPRPPSLCCGGGLEHSAAESRHAGQMSGLDQLESAAPGGSGEV